MFCYCSRIETSRFDAEGEYGNMTSPREMKIEIKRLIVAALRRDGKAVKNVLVSSLSLETGFTAKSILQIMADMKNVGLILEDNDSLTLPVDITFKSVSDDSSGV